MYKTVVVQHLSLHRGDGREGQPVTVTAGHLLDDGSHLRLVDARAHHAVGGQVHLRAQVHRCFDGADLLFILVVALRHDGLDELHRGHVRLSFWLHAEQFPQPHAVVTSVGRQEVYRLPLAAGLVEIAFQLTQRHRLRHAHGRCLLAERRLEARPYDVIDGQLIAEHYLRVGVNVNHCGQTGIVEAKEI